MNDRFYDMAQVSVSVFAADHARLKQEVEKIRRSGADFLHIDVMDGQFVPMKGLDEESIEQIAITGAMPMDIHLMTYHAEIYLARISNYPVHTVWFHSEAEETDKLHRMFVQLRRSGCRCGLAASPGTDVRSLVEFFPDLDEVLLMSTEPGRPNSVFQESVFERLRELDNLIGSHSRKIAIAIDGGLNAANAEKCIRLGAGKVIIGRSYFQSKEKSKLVRRLHECRSRG